MGDQRLVMNFTSNILLFNDKHIFRKSITFWSSSQHYSNLVILRTGS